MAKFGLKSKMMMNNAVLAAGLAWVGWLGHSSLVEVEEKYSRIAEVNFPAHIELSKMRQAGRDVFTATTHLLEADSTATERQAAFQLIDDAFRRFETSKGAYLKLAPGTQSHLTTEFLAIEDTWKRFVQESKGARAAVDANPSLDLAKSRQWIDKTDRSVTALTNALNTLMESHEQDSRKQVESARASVHSANIRTTWVVFLQLFLNFIIGHLFSGWVVRALSGFADQLQVGASEVATASQQIHEASQGLSINAANQAKSVQQTAASIEEMSAMIRRNTEHAERTHEVALTSDQKAKQGKSAIEEMLQAIEQIHQGHQKIVDQVETGNQELGEIVRVIQEIGTKTKVIHEIVFQTKLLSFNASVEAARAGAEGKGFAVVAEEVGKLAQMSGRAAKEISDMLEASVRKVEDMVSKSRNRVTGMVREGKERVEVGFATAKRCDTVLTEIVANASEVNHMAEEISAGSREQSKGVDTVNEAMSELDRVIRLNVESSKQASGATESLSTQAERMRWQVGKLLVLVKGSVMTAAISMTDMAYAEEMQPPTDDESVDRQAA